MVQRESKAEVVLLAAFLLLSVLSIVDSVPLNKSLRGTLRLCSRSLSDALYLVCRERGYNGYSYGDDEPRVDNGQGLVDECCYHPCTYEQLEQYCKPMPGEKRDESRDVMWVDVSLSFIFIIRYLLFLSLSFLCTCSNLSPDTCVNSMSDSQSILWSYSECMFDINTLIVVLITIDSTEV